jgi:hypothetical protein
MLEVPWLPDEGIPRDIDPLGQYARLLDTGGCGAKGAPMYRRGGLSSGVTFTLGSSLG